MDLGERFDTLNQMKSSCLRGDCGHNVEDDSNVDAVKRWAADGYGLSVVDARDRVECSEECRDRH